MFQSCMFYPSPSGEASSLKRDNPLYESQEIRMEMFADVSDEEDGTKCLYSSTS